MNGLKIFNNLVLIFSLCMFFFQLAIFMAKLIDPPIVGNIFSLEASTLDASSGTVVGKEGGANPHKLLEGVIFFFRGDFSWKDGGTLFKIFRKFSRSMRSYTVKENHIGSVVSDILRCIQTDTQTNEF